MHRKTPVRSTFATKTANDISPKLYVLGGFLLNPNTRPSNECIGRAIFYRGRTFTATARTIPVRSCKVSAEQSQEPVSVPVPVQLNRKAQKTGWTFNQIQIKFIVFLRKVWRTSSSGNFSSKYFIAQIMRANLWSVPKTKWFLTQFVNAEDIFFCSIQQDGANNGSLPAPILISSIMRYFSARFSPSTSGQSALEWKCDESFRTSTPCVSPALTLASQRRQLS